MHGRQAMLATVGFVFPKLFGKLPVEWAKDISLNPLEAQYQVAFTRRTSSAFSRRTSSVGGRSLLVAPLCS